MHHLLQKNAPAFLWQNILYVGAISFYSWVQAAEYALVRANITPEEPLNVPYASNLADSVNITAPYSLVTLGASPLVTTNEVTLSNLVSGDKIFITTGLTTDDFSRLFIGQTQDTTMAVRFSVDADSVFNSTLSVSAGSSVQFLMNGNQLSFAQADLLSGNGQISFEEGAAAGSIMMGQALDGFSGALYVNGANTLELENVGLVGAQIGGTGKIIKKGAGTTTFSNTANNFSGMIELQQGNLALASAGGTGVGLLMSDNTTFSQISGSQVLKSFNSVNHVFTEAVSPVASIKNLTLNNDSQNIFSGVLKNFTGTTGSLTKMGEGELILNGRSTYTGTTTIIAGKITLGIDNAIGTASRNIDVRLGAEIDLAGYELDNSTSGGALIIKGTLSNSNTAQPSINNRNLFFSGNSTVVNTSGDIINNTTLSANSFTKTGLGRFIHKGTTTISNREIILTVQEGTFVVDSDTNSSLKIMFQGSGTVEKKGSGRLALPRPSENFDGIFLITDGIVSFEQDAEGAPIWPTQVFTGSIKGAGTLEKNSTHTLALRGDLSEHTGIFEIINGKVSFGANFGGDKEVASLLQTTSAPTIRKVGTNKVILTRDLSGLSSNTEIRILGGTLAIGNDIADYTLSSKISDSISGEDVSAETFRVMEKVGSNKVTLTTNLASFSSRKLGLILTEGTLAYRPNTDISLACGISGSGAFEKLGVSKLTLLGGLGGYVGDLIITQGAVSIYPGQSWDPTNYNTLAASIKGAGELEIQGTSLLTLTGDLSAHTGLFRVSNPNLSIGNNMFDSTLYSEIIGGGGIKKTGSNKLTLAGNLSAYTGRLEVYEGVMSIASSAQLRSGQLVNVYGGILEILPGSSAESVQVRSGAKAQLHRETNQNSMTVRSFEIFSGGVLDIAVKKNAAPNNSPIVINNLNLRAGGGIILHPDITSTNDDLQLVNIATGLTFQSGTVGSFISIIPQVDSPPLTDINLKLLKLESALNTSANKSTILSLITQEGDWDILSSSFNNDGVLSCQLRYLLNAPDLLILSGKNIDILGRNLTNNSITLAGGVLRNSAADVTYSGHFSATANSTLGGSGNIRLDGALSHKEPNVSLKKEGDGALVIATSLSNLSSDIDITQGMVIFDIASGAQEVLQSRLTSTTGIGSVKKIGAGELSIAGLQHNTYTGATEIAEGKVILAKNNALGGGALTVSGGVLDIAGHSLANTETHLSGGVLENSGVRQTYAGNVIVSANSELTGLNVTGTLSVIEGILKVDRGFQGGILEVASSGVFEVDKDLSTVGPIIDVNNLILASGGTIILRPDLRATATDEGLLRIQGALQLNEGAVIKIEPQVIPKPPPRVKVNLLSLGSVNNQEAIFALLQTTPNYLIEDPSFSDTGVLSCFLKSTLQQAITETEAIAKVPSIYKALIRKIFANQSAAQRANELLYEKAAYSESNEVLVRHVRSFSPAGALPSAIYQSVKSTGMNNIVQAQRQYAFLSSLQQKEQGGFKKKGSGAQHLFERIFQTENQHSDRYRKYSESPVGLDLESFRQMNLDGLSFESQLQYQRQQEPNRSEDALGYDSKSWTASFGVSFTKKNQYSIGSLLSTTKTHEKMNPNDIGKSGDKSDRLNVFGIVGYYKLQEMPLIISGLATYGQHNYEQNRIWAQSLPNNTELEPMRAQAQYKAYEKILQGEIGYIVYKQEKVLMVQPFLGATWTCVTNGSYIEEAKTVATGALNEYGYLVPEQSYSSGQYSVGIECVAMRHINESESLIFGRLGVSTQKNTGDESIFRYAIAAAPEAELEMSYENYRYNTADILLGVDTALSEGLKMTLVYTATIGKYLKAHNASLSVDYCF